MQIHILYKKALALLQRKIDILYKKTSALLYQLFLLYTKLRKKNLSIENI